MPSRTTYRHGKKAPLRKHDRFIADMTVGDVEDLLDLLQQMERPFRMKFRGGTVKTITIYGKQ